jgi:pyruvate formate lyase activating enzyme
MNIGGWQKVSLIDYPEKICSILFTQGCNFRCPYCHNPELVEPALFRESLSEEEIFAFLEKRKGKIDAVSITGGEPTIQPDLVEFIQPMKKIGYLIKLDTNGSRPDVLGKLINQKLLDYIAMDVKAPLNRYPNIARCHIDPDKIQESIKMIIGSDTAYEFRTTVVKCLLTVSDLQRIAALIKDARLYVLQRFVSSKCLEKKFLGETTYSDEDFEALKEKLQDDVQCVVVR